MGNKLISTYRIIILWAINYYYPRPLASNGRSAGENNPLMYIEYILSYMHVIYENISQYRGFSTEKRNLVHGQARSDEEATLTLSLAAISV